MKALYTNHVAAVSGSERSMLNLLGGLPANVQPLVACPQGSLMQAARELGVPVTPIVSTSGSLRLHPLHTPRAVAEMTVAARQIHTAARRFEAELVHANSIRAGIELALARVSPAASIVSIRDCLPPGGATVATMRLIARTATCVIANSRYTAELTRSYAPRARLEIVHPSIDVDAFDPARIDRANARARLGVAGTRRVLFGVVAQLTPWKGQDIAIEALRLLRERGVDAHLLLIGSAKFIARSTRFDNNAYVERLRQLITDAGLEDRVSWLGERSDVPELMRAMDALLLPSHEEPFGRALLEAMALEVPVLATNVGGPPELIRDGRDGYLLPPRDAAAWEQAIARVAEDPRLGRELGRAGRERVVKTFNIEDHVRAITDIYARALGS